MNRCPEAEDRHRQSHHLVDNGRDRADVSAAAAFELGGGERVLAALLSCAGIQTEAAAVERALVDGRGPGLDGKQSPVINSVVSDEQGAGVCDQGQQTDEEEDENQGKDDEGLTCLAWGRAHRDRYLELRAVAVDSMVSLYGTTSAIGVWR